MALQKQLVHLNLTGGLQRKDDERLVIPSKLAVADNVEFDDASTVKRRGGQSSVSLTSLIPAIPAANAFRLFTHKGVAYIESGSTSALPGGVHRVWKTGGTQVVTNPQPTTGGVVPYHFRRAGMQTGRVGALSKKGTPLASGNPFYDNGYDCASIGNVLCYVFETRDTNGSGRQSFQIVLIDEATGFKIHDYVVRDSSNILVKPRVVADATKFFVFFASYASGGAAYSVKSMTVTPAGVVTAINTVRAGLATNGTAEASTTGAALFDVAMSADQTKLGLVALAYGGAYELDFTDVSLVDGYSNLNNNQILPTARPTSLTALFSKNATPHYILHAFYSLGSVNLKGCSFNFSTSTTAASETTVGNCPAGTIAGRVAAYESSNTRIYLAYDSYSSYGSILRLSSLNHVYGSLVELNSSSPWYIAGRVAVVQSRLYLPMVHVSTNNQATTFLVDLSEAVNNIGTSGADGLPLHVLARIDYGEIALDPSRWRAQLRVPNTPVSGNKLTIPYLKYEADLRLAGSANETAVALARAVVDFDSQLGDEEINGLTFLAGACPYIYDGSNYVEEGFHHGPVVDPAPTPAAAATGIASSLELPNAVTATFNIIYTMVWQDAQGNLHESAPSNAVSVTITAAGNRFINPGYTLPNTQKANARLVAYRTKGSSTDTSLYLATRADGTFVTSDTELAAGEQIYTTGGVLPNAPAPACRHVSTFQKRLVLSGCGDGSRVHWSKQVDTGYGVEFSTGDPSHQTTVPSERGRVVGTVEMDNALVVVCERGIGVLVGNGPAPTGTQGEYSPYNSRVTEVGGSWDSPKSIILGSDGVWFRSPYGMRLFSRSGSLARGQDGKQAGAEVDNLVVGTPVAVSGDASQQIRFYQSSGTCLVWDAQWQQWSRLTGMANVDAAYADGRFYHLSNVASSALLRYTNPSTYVDVADDGSANNTFTGVVETPWLSLAGIQGFQRVYRLGVLGACVDGSTQPQSVIGGIYLNFDSALNYTFNANVTPDSYGTVQFQHHFKQQKCEAMKLRFTFRPATGNTGQLRISDLTLQIGVKNGYFKLPSSQRF